MLRLKATYHATCPASKIVNKMWTPTKCFVLICTILFLTSQGVSYGHDVLPLDHNHRPYFVNEGDEDNYGDNFVQYVYVSENTSNYIIGSVKSS